MKLNTVEQAIEAFRLGQCVIVIDNDDQDNVGEVVFPVEKMSASLFSAIRKMTKGAISVVASKAFFAEKGLVASYEKSLLSKNFVRPSLSLAKGNLKGETQILETLNALMKPNTTEEDYIQPGVVNAVIGRLGGVLKRAGHPEATLDLAELSGLYPLGVTFEMIHDDGKLYSIDELHELATKHNHVIISIASLIEYRRKDSSLIKRAAEANLPTSHGDFRMVGFENALNGEHHVALVKGDIKLGDEVLVRVHSECLTGDAFGSLKCDCGEQLNAALDKIEKAGKGVLLYMRQEGRGIGLINKIRAYNLQDQGMDTVEANLALGFDEDLRDYGIGAQILSDLGVTKVKLMTNNPLKLKGLTGHGIEITSREPIQLNHNERNEYYMRTKKDKMGHILKFKDE
ncbi:MAG: GTP cyclohydrolase II [Acholeplasma sp.]|jgi:3,4-dihydroxy 2-butanone 4-phosphate synthase/GTP cyclohydrolase II|nr:MAG: GTP cyclohydrolase II [Acholeplasma sp.]